MRQDRPPAQSIEWLKLPLSSHPAQRCGSRNRVELSFGPLPLIDRGMQQLPLRRSGGVSFAIDSQTRVLRAQPDWQSAKFVQCDKGDLFNMRPRCALPATLVAGLGIGVILTTALRAQGTPPAYVVAEVAIHDADTFARDYAPKVAGTLQPYGGRLLVSGGKLTPLEGDVPQRFVIIAFDNAEKARGWYDSPAYQQLVPIRQKTSKSMLFIAEGVSR